jgi:Holliday junction resolvase RusA-like endonuclease
MTMSTEIERYERTLRSLEDELHKEKNLSMELAFKVIIISAEVERNQNGGGMKSKDYADMQ